MIHTDGKPTIANANARDEPWITRLERELMELEKAERERVYIECRAKTNNTFDWLACLEGATS